VFLISVSLVANRLVDFHKKLFLTPCASPALPPLDVDPGRSGGVEGSGVECSNRAPCGSSPGKLARAWATGNWRQSGTSYRAQERTASTENPSEWRYIGKGMISYDMENPSLETIYGMMRAWTGWVLALD